LIGDVSARNKRRREALCKTRTGNDRDACYHTPPKSTLNGPVRTGRHAPRAHPFPLDGRGPEREQDGH
jgi:hypothetical protein